MTRKELLEACSVPLLVLLDMGYQFPCYDHAGFKKISKWHSSSLLCFELAMLKNFVKAAQQLPHKIILT